MAGFRSGWPGAFQLEPLDRYAETERKRASSLVKMTIAEKQRRTAAQRIREAQALRVGSMTLAPVPEQSEKKGGGGAWGKIKGGLDAVTPDALEAPAKVLGTGALKTFQASQEYVGAPLMGLTSGRLGAEQQTLPDGTTFRAGSPSWSDFGRGLKKAVTQDPRDTYQESRQAFKEGQRDPDLPAWKRVAAEALSDPLTYVTPGATGAAAKVLPQGLRASRGARFAGAILADPGRTAAGSVIGSSAAAEVADRTGLPELPAILLGGVAGGMLAAPGNLGRTGRAIDAATDAQERMLPPSRFGSAELGGMEPLPKGKVTYEDFAALGPRPEVRSEKQVFGSRGIAGADPEAVKRWKDTKAAQRQWDKAHKELTARAAKEADEAPAIPEPPRAPDPMDMTMAEITAMKRGQLPDTAAAEDALPPASASAVPPVAGVDAETAPATGLPERITVYHGSRNLNARSLADIDTAAYEQSPTAPLTGGGSYGIFMSTSPRDAAAYGENVIKAEIDTSRFLDLMDEEQVRRFVAESGLEDIKYTRQKYVPGKGFSQVEADVADAILEGDYYDAAIKVGLGPHELQNKILKAAEAQGYGGVVISDLSALDTKRSYVVFDKSTAGIPKPEPPRRLTEEEVIPALQRRIEETRPPGAIPPPKPEPRREDMFDTISGDARLAEEAAFRQTLRGKTEAGLKGAVRRPVSDVKTFLSKERNRISVIRKSREAQADDIFVNATRGLPMAKDADGVNRMPNGASFEDMFERKPGLGEQAYNALSPQQKAQLEPMYEFGERLNANLRFHNKDGRLPWDEDENLYFPRISIGVDGKKRAYISTGDGSGLGGSKGFMEERTFADSFDEGLKEGIDYADSRQAWRMNTRAKLKAAENDAIISRIKPMGIPEAQLPAGRVKGIDYRLVDPRLAPQLSNTYFTPEMADEIEGLLKNDPSFVVKGIEGFNRRATPLRAMADISFLFQQGSPLIFRYPQKAPRALINVIASTKNRKFYDDMINSVGFNKDEAIEHGLIWGSDDLPSTDFALTKAGTEGRFTSKPGIKQTAKAYNKVADFSNETFYRYMNFMKANFVKDAQKRLEKMKPTMSPEEWRKEYQGAMDAINRLGGQTGRQTTSLEKLSLFAPTYFSATVEQLSAAVTKGGMEGQIARAQMLRMLGFGAAMVIGVNALNNKETELDPRSSNFLRFRDIGGLDVSPFGTYDTLFRALAGTAMGDPKSGESGEFMGLKFSNPDFSDAKIADYTKLWKLAEGKMSPGLKFIYEPFIKQGNYRGEPYDPSSFPGLAKIAADQAVSALPFSVQNALTEGIVPSIQEGSLEPLKDALPGILVSGGGATNSPVTPTEKRNWRRDELAQERFGMDYADLSGRDKSIINEDEKIAAYQADADKNIETLVDDRSINQRASNEAAAKLDALSARFEVEKIPGSEFRKEYQRIQAEQRGVRSVLEQMKGDKEVEAYFNVFTMAERDDGSVDYELLDKLLPEFVAQHPGIEDKIDKITGTEDNAVLREFRVAQQQAREYHTLPAYRGLSVEEGKRVQPILARARRLVSNLQAPGYKHALREMLGLGLITREDMILAIRAQKLGTSPERKRFKLEHPEYAKFYNDAVLDEGFADVGTYSGRGSRRRLPSIIDVGPKRPQIGLSLRPIG